MNRAKLAVALEGALPFTFFLTLYLATASRVLSASGDSVYYLNAIDAGTDLFHPHHLLHNAVARAWVGAWRFLGVGLDSAVLVPWLNALFGALGLALLHGILRTRFGMGPGGAWLATCLPGFSFAYWLASGSVEVYMLPLAFLLISFWLLAGERVSRRTFAAVGLLNGVAILLAQIHVLFGVVVLLAAVCRHRRGDIRLRDSMGTYLLTAVPVVAIPYLLVVLSHPRTHSLEQAWYWLTLYAHFPYWYPLALSTALKAGIGFGRASLGAHFLFPIAPVRALVGKALGALRWADEAYLVRGLAEPAAWLLLALSAILGLLAMAVLWRGLRRWKTLAPPVRQAVSLLATWAAAYGAFVFFYAPFNPKLWLAQTVCLWMALAVLVAAPGWERGRKRAVLAGAAGLLAVINYAGSIRYLRDRANDYYYEKVRPVVEVAAAGDLVVVGDSWIVRGYLARFGRAAVLNPCSSGQGGGDRSGELETARRAIEDKLAKGARVFFLEELKPTNDSGCEAGASRLAWEVPGRRPERTEYAGSVVHVLQ